MGLAHAEKCFFFFYEKKIMNEKDSNFLKNLNKRIKKYDTWNLN